MKIIVEAFVPGASQEVLEEVIEQQVMPKIKEGFIQGECYGSEEQRGWWSMSIINPELAKKKQDEKET